MHPYEERPAQEYWEVEDPPDPTVARNGDEFLAELEALAQWSGLTPDQIEHRMRANGDYVPDGVVAETLRGSTLPSEELLVPILWALGCDDETVELWVWVRGNLIADAYRGPDESKKFSDSALAQAVKERRDQSGWRGLHRRAFPDGEDDNDKYVPKRSRSRESWLAQLTNGSWSSRVMIGLVIAGAVTLIAGVAVALTGGGDDGTVPIAGDSGRRTCCAGSAAPGSQTPDGVEPTDFATATPTPRISTSTRPTNSPTPRPTTTNQSPAASPTQAPRLTGSGRATCSSQEGMWVVTVTVTATLTGGSGSDPQGQASHNGTSKALSFTGSFNGQAQFTIGPDTTAANGSISWTVSVSVPGAGRVPDEGSVGFNCGG